MLSWPAKDPDERLDYKVNWTDRLGDSDTIASSQWTVPADLVKESESFDNTVTTIWLSGGTLRKTYQVTNRITTASGRTLDATVTLAIVSK